MATLSYVALLGFPGRAVTPGGKQHAFELIGEHEVIVGNAMLTMPNPEPDRVVSQKLIETAGEKVPHDLKKTFSVDAGATVEVVTVLKYSGRRHFRFQVNDLFGSKGCYVDGDVQVASTEPPAYGRLGVLRMGR